MPPSATPEPVENFGKKPMRLMPVSPFGHGIGDAMEFVPEGRDAFRIRKVPAGTGDEDL